MEHLKGDWRNDSWVALHLATVQSLGQAERGAVARSLGFCSTRTLEVVRSLACHGCPVKKKGVFICIQKGYVKSNYAGSELSHPFNLFWWTSTAPI